MSRKISRYVVVNRSRSRRLKGKAKTGLNVVNFGVGAVDFSALGALLRVSELLREGQKGTGYFSRMMGDIELGDSLSRCRHANWSPFPLPEAARRVLAPS